MSSPTRVRMAIQKPNLAFLVGATAISMGLLLGGSTLFRCSRYRWPTSLDRDGELSRLPFP